MIRNTCHGDLATYLIIRYFNLLVRRIESCIESKANPMINFKALYSYLRNDIDEDKFIQINQEILQKRKSKKNFKAIKTELLANFRKFVISEGSEIDYLIQPNFEIIKRIDNIESSLLQKQSQIL